LDAGRKCFAERAVRLWHGLPREAVGATSLEALKARLDGALGSLSWWGANNPWQGVQTGWSLRYLPTQAVL